MNEVLWTFKTSNFRIVCEEEGAEFIDPLVHDQVIIDAANFDMCEIAHLTALVYWRGNEVGRASLRDCIYPWDEDRRTLIPFSSYRWDVVRKAIRDARRTLSEIQGDLPELYLRKTA